MALFLTTRGISSQLEDIFIEANSFLYIVTPYLQFSKTLYERLQESTKRGVPTTIVCRERGKISSIDEKLLLNLDCSIYFKQELHAKCYMNEHGALVTSLNLYNYSEANNREMGVLLSKLEDSIAYDKCLKEVKSIVNTSQQFRLSQKENLVASTAPVDTYSEYLKGWLQELTIQFPNTKFEISENRVSAKDFPFSGMTFSNEYGFATICFENDDVLRHQRSEKKQALQNALVDYRLYWHSANRICIYHAKDIQFDDPKRDYQYCTKGLNLLLKELSKLVNSANYTTTV